jgi:hypothetical protein
MFLFMLALNRVAATAQLILEPYTREDIEELICATVPVDYVDAFLFYTDQDENPDELRIQLLAIGKLESGWVKTKGDSINSNNSHDLGYLMLNSYNLGNDTFMSRFGPLEEYPAKDKLELYLITCIRFYQYLCQRYGYDNSASIYNAGETKYIKHDISLVTHYYVARVNKYLAEYTDALSEIARKNELLRLERQSLDKTIHDIQHIRVQHQITAPIKYRSYNRKRVIIQSNREFVKRREHELSAA